MVVQSLIYNTHHIAKWAKLVVVLQSLFIGMHGIVITTKGGGEHQERRVRQVEVREHRVSYVEFLGGEDELIGPTFKLLNAIVGAARSFEGTLYGSAYGQDLAIFVLCLIDNATTIGLYKHLF